MCKVVLETIKLWGETGELSWLKYFVTQIHDFKTPTPFKLTNWSFNTAYDSYFCKYFKQKYRVSDFLLSWPSALTEFTLTYLSALKSPSTEPFGWSFKTLIAAFIWKRINCIVFQDVLCPSLEAVRDHL